jgi:PAS domain S-box-containing protein
MAAGHAGSALTDPAFAAFVALVDEAPVTAFIKDADGRYLYVNRYLLSSLAPTMGDDWLGKTDDDLWPPDAAALVRQNDATTLREGTLQLFTQPMPIGDGTHMYLLMKFPLTAADGSVSLAGIGIDKTERLTIATERDRLATVVEQVGESIIIGDLDARITYVNAAFERTTGYSRDEVVGRNPSVISGDVEAPEFYRGIWETLQGGSSWVGDLVSRRKDGSLFNEEAVISPIRDASGAITGYVDVKRDVTRERELEERTARAVRERALIAETIRGIRAVDTPETTAQAICRQVVRWTGITSAQMFIFELDGRAMPIGMVIKGQPDPALRRLPYQRSEHLRDRAMEGPWIEPWVPRRWHPYNDLLTALGRRHLVAYAPIRHMEELIGILVVDAEESVDEGALAESLPGLVEFADLAAALVGRDLTQRTEAGQARANLTEIIATSAFESVFQPIVDIETMAVIGYEALTRFSDGVGPDVRFREAAVIGLGLELETVTLRASVAAAAALPPSASLNLNASPAMIMARKPLEDLVRDAGRPIILEVTEHAAIADYHAFKASFAALRPTMKLAVDDAGAGFASLRHILELQPAYVKLDRSLIIGLESDEARQAMIVGLRHFARSVGCRLIAEGVETEAELEVLRTLEIQLVQGFRVGRPAPAADASN